MQYKIVSEGSQWSLEEKVRDSLKDGWKPQGGVCFTYHGGFRETWAQAMVKE